MDNITPYKISTITATGSINSDVDLMLLYDSIVIKDVISAGGEGVLYAEYGSLRKGVSKKTNVSSRKLSDNHKRFDNQLTLEYRIPLRDAFTVLNCKIFKNGNIQMTGVKYLDQGRIFIDRIIDIIKVGPDAVANKEALKNTNYTIRMINCDYKIGFCIKRDALFKVMMTEYDNMVSFEPCIYPGVKVQYMWNQSNPCGDGICKCNETCINGKGCGKGEGDCKKITVAIFQSGCIIITGAQTEEQINTTYEWINNILIQNKDKIEKKNITFPDMFETPKKKILIPKSKIVSLRPLDCGN